MVVGVQPHSRQHTDPETPPHSPLQAKMPDATVAEYTELLIEEGFDDSKIMQATSPPTAAS